MTALPAPAPAPAAGLVGADDLRVTGPRVVRSEWIKLRTLRSTWITLAVAVVLSVGVGALVSFALDNRWNQLGPAERAHFDAVRRTLVGLNLAQLAMSVLGVLVISGEYGTGMIRATLGAVPRRVPVVAAKALVFGAAALVTGMASSFVSFFVGNAILGVHGTSIGAPHVLRAVFGGGVFLTLVALFALGIGFALRNTAGGIATVIGLLLVLPGVANALPSSWQGWIIPYLPGQAGDALFNTRPDPLILDPWSGFGIFVGWVVASLVVGAVVLRRKDA